MRSVRALLVALAGLFASTAACAAPISGSGTAGDLDFRFQGRGYVSLDENVVDIMPSDADHVFALRRDCIVERYDVHTGAIDPSTGAGARLAIGGECSAFVDGSDGRLYVHSARSPVQRIIRLEADGRRDPSFDITLPYADELGRLVPLGGGVAITLSSRPDTGAPVLAHVWIDP